MAYKETKLLIPGVPLDKVKRLHPAGFCASFTFDWLKKNLARKPLSETTYTKRNRLRKIASRQRTYEDPKSEGLETIAQLYGLRIEFVRNFGTDDLENPSEIENVLKDSNSLYISLVSKHFSGPRISGHALGYDKSKNTFCDVNVGIMDLKDRTLASLICEAINDIYLDEFDTKRFAFCSFYNVTLG